MKNPKNNANQYQLENKTVLVLDVNLVPTYVL